MCMFAVPTQVGRARRSDVHRNQVCVRPDASGRKSWIPVSLVLILVAGIACSARAQVSNADPDAIDEPVRSGPVKQAEDPSGPRRHFRLRNPARLSGDEAEQLYSQLRQEMARGYTLSKLPGATGYLNWKRYNTAPYRSVSHGNRFVSNYANDIARAYGRYEQAGRLPVGSMLAKDSMTVGEDGVAMPGALFLMEKMPAGFSYVSGDWRYTMVMPDGSIFGITNGEGSERVRFCISCHLAVEKHDHLFFIPDAFRRN